MLPELFRIGPFPIHTYGALVALGILAGAALAEWLWRSRGGEKGRMFDLVFTVVLAGLVGARLLFILVNLPWYLAHPVEVVMVWKGGLVFYGGLMGGAAAFFWMTRRLRIPFAEGADMVLPALALGHAFGRLGCLAAGCCYGAPTDLPWAVTFTDPKCLATAVLGVPVHPTQLYESLFLFLLAGFLVFLFYRKPAPGRVAAVYLLAYGVSRFALEFLRDDPRGAAGGLSTSQWISLAVGVIGAAWLARSRRQA